MSINVKNFIYVYRNALKHPVDLTGPLRKRPAQFAHFYAQDMKTFRVCLMVTTATMTAKGWYEH